MKRLKIARGDTRSHQTAYIRSLSNESIEVNEGFAQRVCASDPAIEIAPSAKEVERRLASVTGGKKEEGRKIGEKRVRPSRLREVAKA